MRIRLIRKLAPYLDGIDLSGAVEGDVIDLPRDQARLMIAERWALPFRGRAQEARGASAPSIRTVAADAPARRRTVAHLRRVREQMEQKRFAEAEHRRAEDLIRDQLHDACAITIANANSD